MNLFELQTRANALVAKVNAYEDTIEDMTLDENEIIDQHLYADIFCLRTVMHRLFATTPADRASTSLSTTDVDWSLVTQTAVGRNEIWKLNDNTHRGQGSVTEYTGDITTNNDMMSHYNMIVGEPAYPYAKYLLNSTSAQTKSKLVSGNCFNVYGAHISDALITESQTANIFRWNTTPEDDITNVSANSNIPQQVPGIVTYYLGSGYDGEYSATIPYNTNKSTVAVNYNTPAIYGAFYKDANGPEDVVSQQPKNRGAEGLRMFMPGTTFFNGGAISPIDIYQPFPRYDTPTGYNYQGKALYHELVFKRRRAGCSAANVDFLPFKQFEAGANDNDPQGLAMRLALAQQKPYYYNRPWFTELDELYTTEGTKQAALADKIIEAGQITSYDYDLSDWNFVGNPDVNYETAVVTNLQGNNISYITKQLDLSQVTGTLTDIDIEFTFKFNDTTSINPNTYLFSINRFLQIRLSNNKSTNTISIIINYYYRTNASSSVSCSYSTTVDLTKPYTFKITRVSGGVATFYLKDENGEFQQIGTDKFSRTPGNYNTDNILKIAYYSGGNTTENFYAVPYFDLSDFIVTLNNQQIVVPPTKSDEPVTHTMTDSEFYNNYQLSYDTYAEALGEPQ